MAGRHGSRRNNNGVLKAVLIILTASLALAGITIAVFTRLGNRKNEQAQTTPSLEAPVPEPEKVEREIVSLEIPGTSTETEAVPTETEDNTEAEAVPTETEDNAETEAVPTETEEVTETEAVPTETDNNTETTEPEETGSEEDLYAPAFLSFTNAPMIKAGDAFDIHKFVGYADDVDRDVEIAINGNIDVNTVGKYPVEIVLADDAGHVTSRSMEVNVLTEVPPSIPPETKSEAFSDFIAAYKTDQTSVGIDISRWQDTVDFEKVKAAGCEFVYIRIGGLDDGELYTDRYYMNNIAGAKAQGLKVGIY